MAKPTKTPTAATLSGQEPDKARKLELARLYAALAAELVRWKEQNSHDDEVSGATKPVVWQLHKHAQEASTKATTRITFDQARDRMNDVLRANQQLLGALHVLETAQVEILVKIMVENGDHRAMGPYKPPPLALAW